MSNTNTLVIFRHGLFADETSMQPLEKYINGHVLPGCMTDNEPYRWQDRVLDTGIDLAKYLLSKLAGDPKIQKIIMVGHCQGGLVCRVAAATICDHAGLLGSFWRRDDPWLTNARTELRTMDAALLGEARKRMHSVVMLGTPNSGMYTYGQLSMLATIAVRETTRLVTVRGWNNFTELTTDRLFTLLQKVRVPDVKYVSLSGSSHSRYGAALGVKLADLPLISRLAPSLEVPNDGIVEDSSVDLGDAPLPPEIEDLDKQYKHVRSYTECIRVAHRELAWDQNVFDKLRLTTWWQ
jgi:pimeloyl-ACP methyl ester carboxylesterase